MNRPIIANGDGKSMHGWTATDRPDFDRRFRSARRHSRLVRFLRVWVPAGVVIGGAGFAFVSWFNPIHLPKLPIGLGGLVVSGSKITMQAPRLAGFTRDARPYALTAKTAAQDLTKPDELELSEIRAQVEMGNKTTVQMVAQKGLYNTKAEQMMLRQGVVITSSSGYEGRLSEAVVDVRKGRVVSDKPVELKLINGTLNAKRLEITDSGDLVRFDGGVDLFLKPMGKTAQAARGAPAR
jgi:lipopolysaccharide export system protein LptC